MNTPSTTHPGPHSRGRRPHRGQRGMVTAEIALAIIPLTLITLLLGWGMHLVTQQMLLEDVVAEVARQSARGDLAAAQAARDDAPEGTSLSARQSREAVTVEAELTPTMPGSELGITLTAEATVLKEPGQS